MIKRAPSVTGGVVYATTDQGYLVALADPLVWPPAGYRCTMDGYATHSACTAAGHAWVPAPGTLKTVALDGSRVWTEPAIANGLLFVATDGGHVYMLSP